MAVLPRYGTSIQLAAAGLSVLRDQPSLLVFPILSGATMAGFLFSLFHVGIVPPPAADGGLLFVTFVVYFGWTLVISFFNVALAYNAHEVFHGRDPGFHDGLLAALRRFGTLLKFAALVATIAVVLQLLEETERPEAEDASTLFATSWSAISYFIVPLIVFYGEDLSTAIHRSGNLFLDNWYPAFGSSWGIRTTVMAAAFTLVIPVAMLTILVGGIELPIAGGVLVGGILFPVTGGIIVVALVGGYLLASSLAMIAKVALFVVATEEEPPKQFRGVDFARGRTPDDVGNYWTY